MKLSDVHLSAPAPPPRLRRGRHRDGRAILLATAACTLRPSRRAVEPSTGAPTAWAFGSRFSTRCSVGRVAIKVLPASVCRGPRSAVSLRTRSEDAGIAEHPNIAQIYGTEQSGSTHALVMQLVDGEDLAARLARGALPIDEALQIAKQIADGLEAARRAEHHPPRPQAGQRQSQPGWRPARYWTSVWRRRCTRSRRARQRAARTASRILNAHVTCIRSTARSSWVPPRTWRPSRRAAEPSTGAPTSGRSDAFVYEMLSGKRPFGGDDTSMTLAAILKQDVDFTALPDEIPTSIRRLLRRCLEKDPRKRLHSIADAALDLNDAAAEPAGPIVAARGWRTPLLWGAAARSLPHSFSAPSSVSPCATESRAVDPLADRLRRSPAASRGHARLRPESRRNGNRFHELPYPPTSFS